MLKKKIKTILFDLDGTLLPMNENVFTKKYFQALAQKLVPYGYDCDKLIAGILKGTSAMIKNDGTQSNEQVFWKTFENIFGERVYNDKAIFDEFYRNEFQNLKNYCDCNNNIKQIIKFLKKQNYKLIIASNPVFPLYAQQSRIKWAGLDIEDFDFISSYENSHYTKPNINYYKEIIKKFNLKAEECLMIGNNVTEDMVANKIGINVFLLTDCISNKDNIDISISPNGDLIQLENYIKSL